MQKCFERVDLGIRLWQSLGYHVLKFSDVASAAKSYAQEHGALKCAA